MNKQRLGTLVGASALALALGSLSLPSDAAPTRPAEPQKVDKQRVAIKDARPLLKSPRDRDPQGRAAYFVQIAGPGAADAASRAGGGSRGASAARSRATSVRRAASAILTSARRADAKATAIYTVTNALPGTGLLLDAAGRKAVASDSRVVSVKRIVPKTAETASVVQLVQALKTWKFSGNTGKGVTIGIIDSGIDYTHADFGGKGTTAAYDAAFANSDAANWRSGLPAKAKKKVVGGYDFAGDAYDADPDSETYNPISDPDNNPLDCADNGHGSHVGGIAAGYGVTAAGKTFRGDYGSLTGSQLQAMDIGPGTAPKASIFALRVFGCTGSTDLVIPALDRALDPNGDGVFSDHLEIINMSLGSDYGPVDDPDNAVVNELTNHGVLTVNSIGNNGDLTDTGGSPGNSESTLAVASTVDSYQLRDGLKVNGPANVAGIAPGQMSVAYDWPGNGPTHAPVSGAVAKLSDANSDGCDPLVGADITAVAGKVAWLTWDSDDSTRRCGSVARSGNVAAAGGVGAVFTGDVEPFGAGITGSDVIPVFQVTKAQTAKLQPAVNAGTLNVTFDGALQGTVKDYSPEITDTISSFTSRGPHGSVGVVKPDVAAPGDTVASAGVGTGNKVLVESGTSMAAPATAGVAALVQAAHPKWSPLKLKAAIMNTARHDLWSEPGKSGHKYAPARVGAGRIDAKGAVQTKFLAYVDGADNPVSASFGVVPVPINAGTVKRTKTLTIRNFGKETKTVRVKYEAVNPSPGVTYSVSPAKVKVKAKKAVKVTVTMSVNPTALRHTIDPTMDELQLETPRQFVSDSSGRLLVKPGASKALRVPVYGAAKPASTTTSSVSNGALTLTGSGFETGGSSSDYTSLVSVLEFGAWSPKLPTCAKGVDPEGCATAKFERAGDIAQVGAGSTNGEDGFLYFGMTTHAEWTQLGLINSPEFDYDTTGDGEPDYYTYVSQFEGSDLFYALTYAILPDGDELVDLWPINFLDGNVDTNVFDNNVVLLPVLKSSVGLAETGSAPISYAAYTWNGYYGVYTDETDVIEYDAGEPAVGTEDVLFLDQGGESIALTGPGGANALVLHLHGRPGGRAEVVAVPAAP